MQSISASTITALDRESCVQRVKIDPTEYRFKLALVSQNYPVVLDIIKHSNLVGQGIIAYLDKKGYPEVALQFVQDPNTRFELALECGNMDVAFEVAKTLDTPDSWRRLGVEALAQGSISILEKAYQRTNSYDKLSFLYLVSGNIENLKKMQKIAERRGDSSSRFHNSLYLGDVEDQVAMLKDVGQCLFFILMDRSTCIPCCKDSWVE